MRRKDRLRTILDGLSGKRPDGFRKALRRLRKPVDMSPVTMRVDKAFDGIRGLSEALEGIYGELDTLRNVKPVVQHKKDESLHRKVEQILDRHKRHEERMYAGEEALSEAIESARRELSDEADKRESSLRREMLGMIGSASSRGGSMNRQIRVNGTDVLTRYTDINLTGALTATVDNANRRVNIAIADAAAVWGSITGTVTDQTDLVSYVTGLPVSTFGNDAGYVTSSHDYGTQGSVLFLGSSGQISEDNSNIFWDDTNNRLRVGTGSSVEARIVVRTDAIGEALTESAGILAKNGTTVPSGFSAQYSPPITMVGYRRGFAGGGEIKVTQYVKTSAFGPQQWAIAMSVDGGAYTEIFNIDDLGDATFTGEILGVSAMTVTGVLRGAFLYGDTTSGSAGSPTFSFFGDADTGMFRAGANVLGFSTAAGERMRIDGSGNAGFGTTTVSARLHAISTTEQLRLGYDASNYLSVTVGSTGGVTFNANGSGQQFTFSDKVTASGEVELDGALNHDGTTVGLYGMTPVTRATTGIAEAAFTENSGGTAVNVDSTFGGYTLQQIAQALQVIGILT